MSEKNNPLEFEDLFGFYEPKELLIKKIENSPSFRKVFYFVFLINKKNKKVDFTIPFVKEGLKGIVKKSQIYDAFDDFENFKVLFKSKRRVRQAIVYTPLELLTDEKILSFLINLEAVENGKKKNKF